MSSSAWNKNRNIFRLSKNKRPPKKSVLITCEGTKTEPNYFYAFRISSVKLKTFPGRNTLGLVKDTIKYIETQDVIYDDVWCVFDRDNVPSILFNKAINHAHANNINVAYSNPCFELWYLLHFQDVSSTMTVSDCISKIKKHLKYNNNDPHIYDDLLELQEKAIMRAKKLEKIFSDGNYDRRNPSTTVHALVSLLNKYL